MSNGGKGSRPRPFSVDSDTFASNWENIFGKKLVKIHNNNETPDQHGDQRINKSGILEEYYEGYWSVVPFKSSRD